MLLFAYLFSCRCDAQCILREQMKIHFNNNLKLPSSFIFPDPAIISTQRDTIELKSSFLFWLIDMSMICQHVHRQELRNIVHCVYRPPCSYIMGMLRSQHRNDDFLPASSTLKARGSTLVVRI